MSEKSPEIFQKTLQVQDADLDEMLHVNNVRYLQWVQDVAKAHWNSNAPKEWHSKYAWVALNHYIEYKKPAFLNDQIIIKTHVGDCTGPKYQRLVRIFNETTEQLLVQASSWWCLIDAASKKPLRVTEEIKNIFEVKPS